MIFREATITDIPQIQIVRHSVKENVLSNPALVTDQHCVEYLTIRGKGWVCEVNNEIVGFAIVDLKENNVWALFLKPEYEGKGIGKRLLNTMLNWYFSQTKETFWLGTGFHTRAEKFYRLQGWTEAGLHGSNEIRFEMSYDTWLQKPQV
ncbi:GNAT family N-acetyltransferase [Pontibacter vulgaris]|uniref:GNAT family N-acetyltransferase n=1 Tax=Pontibacter vulgaris TaxID=2905679 RepID=UPI001FA71004|nr:GNAT family N-acetyltransferase [Pontibacter vulgaris]